MWGFWGEIHFKVSDIRILYRQVLTTGKLIKVNCRNLFFFPVLAVLPYLCSRIETKAVFAAGTG